MGAKWTAQLDAVSGIFGWKLDAEAMARIDCIVAESLTDTVVPEYLAPQVREN